MRFDSLKAERLAEATAVGEEFASKLKRNGVVGIVFLGGVARGYFNRFSDVDIIVFKRRKARLGMKREDEVEYKGFVIDYEIVDYEDKLESEWDMEARWAFSTARIFYDPEGKIGKLIARKVCLKEREKKWMIIEGLTQSEWYCNTVSESWVHRGDMVSAHRSINLALEYLFKALFGLNNQLLPSEKWLAYQAQQLSWLPEGFNKMLREITLVREVSIRELRRRRSALNNLWRQMLQRAKKETGMKFSEFKKLV
ncbi:MAG: nucleotidyltransferase domain-containing protein [Candidatus Brockarchaeota archaeon]|nr:nucleotidyltransferase domain-containing protein [Candidatus Brockarchaeota archaeon]MBO3809323.1 nucleotidyltransferase domain-containing protein [Candidatus Brockarchaeota archaeon]